MISLITFHSLLMVKSDSSVKPRVTTEIKRLIPKPQAARNSENNTKTKLICFIRELVQDFTTATSPTVLDQDRISGGLT